jgi:hypothetical protein
LAANWSSLAADYVARQKVSGLHLKYNLFKQFPVLRPSTYTDSDCAFIIPRVLELTYTSHSVTPFARELGCNGPPFKWDKGRRAQLRADLDAFYARAYGLARDELRYILDPGDVKGSDYPSETFRVLKTNEIRRFGEFKRDLKRQLFLKQKSRHERRRTHTNCRQQLFNLPSHPVAVGEFR